MKVEPAATVLLRPAPGVVVDGYQLERRLGRGDEGTVYRAVERLSGIGFALKLLRDDGRTTSRRAGRVARRFHRLRGTGAVAAYHRCGRVPGYVYLVFEHLEGARL